MCQDLSEYDPFEPYWFDWEYGFASYPMEEYNWEEFLEADDYLC